MTRDEAIQVLDQATSMAALNRQSHNLCVEALRLLQALTEKKPDESHDVERTENS